MKYIIVFEVESGIETDNIEDGIRLAKAEADGMSRVLWANTNYKKFKVKDVRVDYEFKKRIKQLKLSAKDMLKALKNSE